MTSHILSNYGFKPITLKTNVDTVEKPPKKEFDISIVRSQDHANPQIVFKLPREILNQMKWDISDRILLLSNSKTKKIVLSKTNKKDPDSFAISAQGASIEVAKKLKRGGIVKVGWRPEICDEITGNQTYSTTCEVFDNSLVVSLPCEIFS